jgi:drug/metabolite transporter (DMT)-like permease
MRTLLLTIAALTAFAANSLLCRAALGSFAIDPASFTTLRIASGAVFLAIVSALRSERDRGTPRPGLASVAALFIYMTGFSFAYTNLGAGTGALILFGAVQLTMFLTAVRSGERPAAREWIGVSLAALGLVLLVLPGLSAPSPLGAALMAAAGVGWGVYSLLGRRGRSALVATTQNFLYCVPLALLLSVIMLRGAHVTTRGVVLALASGVAASGLGYVIWYAALKNLSATGAATVQLAAPVLAAFGGVLFLDEVMTLRLSGTAVLILGGIGLAVAART